MKSSSHRIILGFLIAPGAPALGLYLINLFFVSHQESLLLGIILAVSSYGAAMVMGIPIYLVLQRRGPLGMFSCIKLGALVGFLAYAFIYGIWGLSTYQSFPQHTIKLIESSVSDGINAVACGIFAGWMFWLIALKSRNA